MKFVSVLKNEKILSPDNICSLYHREYCDTGDKGVFVNVQNKQYWRLLRKIAENTDEDIPIDKESMVVTQNNFEEFLCYIEDPKWRQANVGYSNLIFRGDPIALDSISIIEAIKH